jgi:hypothetical protein
MADKTVNIRFPVKCHYTGGIAALGKRGKHLWIQDGLIGHGEFSLTHSIPMAQVTSVEVTERVYGETGVPIQVYPGVPMVRRVRGTAAKQETEIAVVTKDGQEGHWLVEQRGRDWVLEKVGPALRKARIQV